MRMEGEESADTTTLLAEAAVLAELRAAFGPETGYWRANTAADTLADWREYRAAEPGLTLRSYARLLLHHEAARWGTPAWPLMRRLVAFLRAHGVGHPRTSARDYGLSWPEDGTRC